MAGRQDYEERKEARIVRFEYAASKARAESADANKRSSDLVKDIPFGQPNIEGRPALPKMREKSWNLLGKSIELNKKADYYAQCAEVAENNMAISSDDPNSIAKLEEKIAKLKKYQIYAKKLNTYYKKNGTAKGFENTTDTDAAKIDMDSQAKYNYEKRPFPSYELTSINQRIKTAQKRINEIKTVESMPAETIKYEGVCELVSNADINRVTIEFYIDLTEEQVKKIKSYGFKWSYTNKKWQRLRSPYALRLAKDIIECQLKELSND